MHEAVIFAVALAAGSVASVTGFGIGSLLTPLLAASMEMRLEVAAVAVPHAVGTALRFWMLGAAPDRQVLWNFGLASAAGGLLGAMLQGWAGNPRLTLVLGVLLVATATSELAGLAGRLRFQGPFAPVAGGISGFLGGLVGNQGGLRSAALLGFDMRRDTFVATATAIGLLVDAARTPYYVWAQGQALIGHAAPIATATAGVVAGTLVGGRVLACVPPAWFRQIVATIIGMLGIWVISQLWK
jgi:uncharacterized membrane protein YfcA